MTYFDEKLAQCQAQAARQQELEAKLRELRRQRDALQGRVARLEEQMHREQSDVDRLEGRTLTALLRSLRGDKEERLEQERREAYAAAAKYDAAVRELESVGAELDGTDEEHRALGDCRGRYAAALEEKAAAVKAAGGAQAREILEAEAQLDALTHESRELTEAIAAGRQAQRICDGLLGALDDARGYGAWDLFGGGLIADLAKHDCLDNAQARLGELQHALRRFQTELADVRLTEELQISVEGFLRFADFFFDGFFADWAVQSHIEDAMGRAGETGRRIVGALHRLEAMARDNELRRVTLRQELDEKILQAK